MTIVTLIKHNKSKRHRLRAIDSKTVMNSVIAQMDAIDLNSRRDDDDDDDDDDWGTNVNSWGSPKDDMDCDAQGGPSLAKNVYVGVLTPLHFLNSKLLLRVSAPICLTERQHFKSSPLCFGVHISLYVVPFILIKR